MKLTTTQSTILSYFAFATVALVFCFSTTNAQAVAGYSTTINPVSDNQYEPTDIGPVTLTLDKTSYQTTDPVKMDLQFTPRTGLMIGYRLTNDQDYVPPLYTGSGTCTFCAGGGYPAAAPSGMIIVSDAVQNPLSDFTLASSLPAGTYHLYVFTRFVNQAHGSQWGYTTQGWLDQTKYTLALAGLSFSDGTRLSWSTAGNCMIAWQTTNTAQSTTPGPSAVGGCVSLMFPVGGGSYPGWNMGHSQITFTVTQPTTNSFDFTLTNGGDKTTVPGGVVVNTITSTLTQGTAVPVALSVKSITNSSGASVLNQTNGISVTNTSFSSASLIPTQTGNVRLDVSASTPAGVYTVTVAGNTSSASSATVSTSAPGTIYYCKSVYTALSGADLSRGKGETFACDKTQTFSPLAISGAMDFINWDDVSYGAGGIEPYYDTWVYKDWLIGLRTIFANTACGTGNWTLYPYGYSANLRDTGFICNPGSGTTVTASSNAFERTTTFAITVDTYNLIAEKGADVCSATDAYTKLTWTRNASATQYRLYKRNGTNPETYVAVPQPSSGTTVTFYDPDSNLTNGTGLVVGDLYTYRVAASVGGVFQASSPTVFAFPSSVISCPSNAITFTVGGGDITLKQGTSATISIPLTLTSGGTQSASVQFTPSNANITFSPATPSCSAMTCTITTTVTASGSAPVGATTFTVTGRSSSGTTVTNTLIVRVTANSNPYPVTRISVAGPCSGDSVINLSSIISFTTPMTADPDNDSVTYEYQNDTGSGYGTSVSIGAAKYFTLVWTTTGTKKVRVRALDSRGAYSPWVEQSVTVRASCPGGGETTLISSCTSGFNATTNEATWFASATGGKPPYTYSWNNADYSESSLTRTYIAALGATASAPVLTVKDSAQSVAAASPTCTDITRPINSSDPITFTVPDKTITLQKGSSATVSITAEGTSGVSKLVTITTSQPVNNASGGVVSYVTLSPSTALVCASIIPTCSKDIQVTVDSILGRAGTFSVTLTGTASSGETSTGTLTIIVTDKPVIPPTVNLTLSSGTPTCTQTSIIARWNKDNNASGYNLYRWKGSPSNDKLKINNSPIPQPASGTIVSYTDDRVTANDAYSYEVREIIGGVESTASTYSTRTAPAPTLANCPSGFGFSISSNDFIARPGDTVNISAYVRLLLGTSRPINLSLNSVIMAGAGEKIQPTHVSFMQKIRSLFGLEGTIANAADEYVGARINGSANCPSIPCDIPLVVTISASASDGSYLIPLTARSDNNVIALGYVLVVVSAAPVTRINTSSIVTLLDGMADCNNSAINVSWTKDLNASGYYVYRSNSGSTVKTRLNATPLAQPSGAKQYYYDTNLAPGTAYTYEVRAVVSGKETNPSPSATAVSVAVPYVVGSCNFGMTVTSDSLSMKAGEEKTVNARIVLNVGPSVDVTLSTASPQMRSLVSDASGNASTPSLGHRILDFVGALPIKLNAAGTVTATVTSPVCTLSSTACVIPIRVTSSVDATSGTYSFPLTAVTNTPVPIDGIVTARATLPVEIVPNQTNKGCPPYCGPTQPTFSLGTSATDATVTVGQNTSSQVSVFTISPSGVDRTATVTLGTPISTATNRPVTYISLIPNTFTCPHTSPTCTQIVQIITSPGTSAGTYTIPVLARASTNETAQVNIALTVTAPSVTTDSEPIIETRTFYPSGSSIGTAWTRDTLTTPRRSAYLAPVVIDLEVRKVLASAVDFDKCYTTVDNNTSGLAQGTKDSPVNASSVFTRKTATIIGSETFKIYCKTSVSGSFTERPNASIVISPINVPVVKEF